AAMLCAGRGQKLATEVAPTGFELTAYVLNAAPKSPGNLPALGRRATRSRGTGAAAPRPPPARTPAPPRPAGGNAPARGGGCRSAHAAPRPGRCPGAGTS